jgi:hypothetical protein
MKSVLLGNGVNIQFGGKAYSNDFIMKRIKYRAALESYNDIFGNVLTSDELRRLLNNFVDIANKIRNGNYDVYVKDNDTLLALNDFKHRYSTTLTVPHKIMLEDWFFILHMFFLKMEDLTDNIEAAKQGFERLILDAIYNGGKIQKLYCGVSKKVKKYFDDFDNIFTLNYDNNIEQLTKKKIYHLHGDFSVLSNSENPNNVQGFIRINENSTVVIDGMEHCFCNALLNYSGWLKYKTATAYHNLIVESELFEWKYNNDTAFVTQLQDLKDINPFAYNMFLTKIANPNLNIATEYYFYIFESIKDELYIIGMSPNNDEHIFDLILKNKNLKKVFFYYFKDEERQFIENNFPNDLFKCKNVQELWFSLDCVHAKYTCNYSVPHEIEQFIVCFNTLSGDPISKETILKEVNQIPKFEMKRLCKLVKTDMDKRNPDHKPTNEKEFIESAASISYIALQEGILPSTLYMVCIMNFKDIRNI